MLANVIIKNNEVKIMPIIKINTAKTMSSQQKSSICDRIYQTLPSCINANVEGIKILISNYPDNSIYSVTSEMQKNDFVLIDVSMWIGRTITQKRDMCKNLTQIVQEILAVNTDEIWMTINEFDRSNWGKGGLLCDL
jgi:4-oxalocrotonate tautomerase